ncbi:MAG: BrnT family toxin [Proteobacteria bacterium]|nr:BrnT family toxin [Pseudomonadota bacterium]
MKYEWDDDKQRINLIKHGIDFQGALEFEWDTASETVDNRQDYDETRWVTLGLIKDRLHVLVYTIRVENIRIISLRKANKREVQFYENKT